MRERALEQTETLTMTLFMGKCVHTVEKNETLFLKCWPLLCFF